MGLSSITQPLNAIYTCITQPLVCASNIIWGSENVTSTESTANFAKKFTENFRANESTANLTKNFTEKLAETTPANASIDPSWYKRGFNYLNDLSPGSISDVLEVKTALKIVGCVVGILAAAYLIKKVIDCRKAPVIEAPKKEEAQQPPAVVAAQPQVVEAAPGEVDPHSLVRDFNTYDAELLFVYTWIRLTHVLLKEPKDLGQMYILMAAHLIDIKHLDRAIDTAKEGLTTKDLPRKIKESLGLLYGRAAELKNHPAEIGILDTSVYGCVTPSKKKSVSFNNSQLDEIGRSTPKHASAKPQTIISDSASALGKQLKIPDHLGELAIMMATFQMMKKENGKAKELIKAGMQIDNLEDETQQNLTILLGRVQTMLQLDQKKKSLRVKKNE